MPIKHNTNVFTKHQKQLIEKINLLKKQKNAVILVHNYQRPEIYEVADYIGDSLGLSKEASKTKADIILFCGVDFMAETAKILNPSKKVLLSVKDASCPMAAMVYVDEVIQMKEEIKKKNPNSFDVSSGVSQDVLVVSYVNTTADVKAVSDICCTSANAVKVIESLPKDRKILFVPDRNLGDYVKKVTGRDIIIWPGFCHSHHFIKEAHVLRAKEIHHRAKVIAHPECKPDVLRHADEICSTEGMIKYAKENSAKEFIILTEQGMINRLKRELPNKEFYMPELEKDEHFAGYCFNMKKTDLEKVYETLLNESNEIIVPEEIRVKAKKAIDRMLEIK